MSALSSLHWLAAQHGIKLGWVGLTRRAATPHTVECDGLTRQNLTRPIEFERALRERQEWCERHAPGDYEIEPIGPNPEQLTGRRFRFVDPKVAVAFKLTFPVNLWP
jgi:hypothetical protein